MGKDLTSPGMWSYWLDKRGSPREVLECDYPELLKETPELQNGLALIKAGEALILRTMGELEDKGDDDDD